MRCTGVLVLFVCLCFVCWCVFVFCRGCMGRVGVGGYVCFSPQGLELWRLTFLLILHHCHVNINIIISTRNNLHLEQVNIDLVCIILFSVFYTDKTIISILQYGLQSLFDISIAKTRINKQTTLYCFLIFRLTSQIYHGYIYSERIALTHSILLIFAVAVCRECFEVDLICQHVIVFL